MLKSSIQALCQIDLPPFNFHPLIILSRPVLYESTSGNSGIVAPRQTVLISCPYKPVLRVYNTATRKVEEFKSIEEKKVGMYVCGLTVYNDMHLGHARTYIAFDVIRRWLEYSGYEVNFVQNHTDIDDKIIKRANEENISFEKITKRFINRTQEDSEKLQVKSPTVMPKATDYIREMITIISDLIQKEVSKLSDPKTSDKERYISSYKIETLKEISQ